MVTFDVTPKKLNRVTIDIGSKKKSLLKYTTSRGWSVSYVVRKLVEKLLNGEITL